MAAGAAAMVGEYEELLRVIQEWRVDARDGEGRMVLHAVAGRGHVRCVMVLVDWSN